MVYFPGDDLLAAARPRGLPIGNLTSQFWSNCYLDPLDHFIKRELKCPAYIRYVDDTLLFANDKPTLHRWRAAIIDYLVKLRLVIHTRRAHPRPVTEGIPFLGFVVYPDHRRLKSRKVVAYRRRLKRIMASLPARRDRTGRGDCLVAGLAGPRELRQHLGAGRTDHRTYRLYGKVKCEPIAHLYQNLRLTAVVKAAYHPISQRAAVCPWPGTCRMRRCDFRSI